MFSRIRGAPSLAAAAERAARDAGRALETLGALPVRRGALLSAVEDARRQALRIARGGEAGGGDIGIHTEIAALRAELAKFTSELLAAKWTAHAAPHPKIARAVSGIFAVGHGQLLSLETLADYAACRHPDGALQSVALVDSVDDILSSARALGVEKFGVHPQLDVRVGRGLRFDPAAAPLLEFAMIELLKNAFGAMVERHGALDVEDAPPVKIHLEGASQTLERLLIEDFGTGMDGETQRGCFQPLVTTLVDDREDPWKYSRTFGAKFAGAGLGAFRARLSFLHLGARDVNLRSDAGVGTAIDILFDRGGGGAATSQEVEDGGLSEEEDPKEDLSKFTVLQLKDMLRGKGLGVSGRKAELMRRLEEAEWIG
jgi:hypothetical protein